MTVLYLHIGLMKRLFDEHDREWWARLGGLLLQAMLMWLCVFAVTVYAAAVIKWLAGLALAGGLTWLAVSVGGVLLGKSTLTGFGGKAWPNALAMAAPYVFIIGLVIVLAAALQTVLADPGVLCDLCEPIAATPDFQPVLAAAWRNVARICITDVLWVGGVCAIVFGIFGLRVDINLFSLHGFYRNRLTRCYLGATRLSRMLPMRVQRDANPFTGFDPNDDLPLSALIDQRPYPIINAAMNLTGGEDLAWQTRRAAAFAFTPCHTGFEFWKSDGDRLGAYRCTQEYAAKQFVFGKATNGISLGEVVAISGAAANPNMGYHSSASLSVLLSLFCVRLGRWCGNPRHASAWRKVSPRFGGFTLLKEVFGMLNSQAAFLRPVGRRSFRESRHLRTGAPALSHRRCGQRRLRSALPLRGSGQRHSQVLDGLRRQRRNRSGGDSPRRRYRSLPVSLRGRLHSLPGCRASGRADLRQGLAQRGRAHRRSRVAPTVVRPIRTRAPRISFSTRTSSRAIASSGGTSVSRSSRRYLHRCSPARRRR